MTNTPEQPDLNVPELSTAGQLDRVRLGQITQKALEPGALFGRDFDLSDSDREQLQMVVTGAETNLAQGYLDPAWQEFESLMKEGDEKGVLMAFATHQGTNVPAWCIDGGEAAVVKKVRLNDGDRPAIEVPTRVFNLYHWTRTIESLKQFVTTSSKTLKGTSTKKLGSDLSNLSHLIHEPEN